MAKRTIPHTWHDLEKMAPPWKREEAEHLADARIFTLEKLPSVSPSTGKSFDFFRLRATDWVNVVSITTEGDMILVIQQRHGICRATLEVPAGLVDKGEEPVKAALRELEEETGYIPGEIVHIGTTWPNPAFLTNRCYTYLATGCASRGKIARDTSEELEVILVPQEERHALLTSGMLGNANGIVALYWYDLHLRGIPWTGDENMGEGGSHVT